METLDRRSAPVTRRYVTLDGMRGVAALCVMLLHAENLSPIAVPGGYLAVDLFLGLSGFVIAGAYGSRMADLRTRGLMRLRFIRLYPLYFVGFVLGALVLVLQAHARHLPLPAAPLATGLLLLPSVAQSGYLYAANPPSWSLGCEALVNWGYGLLGSRRNSHVLVLILLTGSGAVIVYSVLRTGNANLGADWSTAGTGLARSVFSFTLGVLLSSAIERWQPIRRRSALSPFFLLTLVPVFALSIVWRAHWDLLCIFVIFPVLVYLGALVEPKSPAVFEHLGDASYALYCIHFPLLAIGRAMITRFGLNAVIAGPAVIAAIVLLAFGLHRWFDVPVRRKLAHWL